MKEGVIVTTGEVRGLRGLPREMKRMKTVSIKKPPRHVGGGGLKISREKTLRVFRRQGHLKEEKGANLCSIEKAYKSPCALNPFEKIITRELKEKKENFYKTNPRQKANHKTGNGGGTPGRRGLKDTLCSRHGKSWTREGILT